MISRTFRLAVASSLLFALCFFSVELHGQNMFVRGDVDDSGEINLTDPVYLLDVLFVNWKGFPCVDAADADDSGGVEVTDAVYLLNFLFRQGLPPPPPFPACGRDPTEEGLWCRRIAVRCQNESLDELFDPLDGHEALVFVVDRSESMQNLGELDFAKSEAIRRIQSFPEDYEFAVISFDRNFIRYPEDGTLVRATQEEKLAAADWIDKVFAGSPRTCPEEALSAALTTLRQSAAVGKRIVYLGDGGATCDGRSQQATWADTLETVAAQNTEGVIIHAVAIETFMMRRRWLQAFVDASGGLLVEIDL